MKYLLVATLTEYCSCDVYTGLLEPIRHSNIAPMGLSNEAGLSVDCGGATRVTSPPKVMSSTPAAWRVVCGCCFYEGLGHWLGVGGSFRSTLGSLRPLSGLCPLGKYQNFSFSLLLGQLVKFFLGIFFQLFFKLFPNFFQSYSYMYIHVFPSFAWPPRAWPKGGGHFHSWQWAVSHVTPVTVV